MRRSLRPSPNFWGSFTKAYLITNLHRKKKGSNKKVLLVLGSLVLSSLVAGGSFATESTANDSRVELERAASFAVLAGSGITNTGVTTVTGTAGGNLGSSPTPAFTGHDLVDTSGTKYTTASDVVAAAKLDLETAYFDAEKRTPSSTVAGDLGGQKLFPGVHNAVSAINLNGTLTLDAQDDATAVFIFQAGSTLTTASSSEVVLINGAQACNVFWQVGSSATLGTSSIFAGNIMAFTSITVTAGVKIHGSLLASNGAVTLDTNTITNDGCLTPEPEPEPEPTVEPEPEPTVEPEPEPTVEPTVEPTTEPTTEPTVEPTVEPEPEPTVEPTVEPTTEPTTEPTVEPTTDPTVESTSEPSAQPTAISPAPEATTATGGELPEKGTNGWLLSLGAGALMLGTGAATLTYRRKQD
jgi:hypothetical protein